MQTSNSRIYPVGNTFLSSPHQNINKLSLAIRRLLSFPLTPLGLLLNLGTQIKFIEGYSESAI